MGTAGYVFSPAPVEAQAPPEGLVQRAGIYLLALLVFLQYSRVTDLAFSYLHLPLIVLVALSLLAALAPNMIRMLFSRPSLLFAFLSGWIFVVTPFSIWVGGSMAQLPGVVRAYLLGLLILIFCTSLKNILLISRSLAGAVVLAAVMSSVLGQTEGGRLVMGQGNFGDPNEFAATLLLGLPLLVGAVWMSRAMFYRLIGMGMVVLVVVAILRTGSRGALIALVASILFFLAKVPLMQKILGLAASLILGAIIWAFLPVYLQVRFTTLFQEQSQVNDAFVARYSAGDVGSSESRLSLLQDGVRVTLKHPLFGVGPGMFPLARWEEGKDLYDVNRGWLVTHNSYLQISSETGLIGLFLLLGVLYSSWKALNRVQSSDRPLPPEYHLTGLHLRVTLTGFCIAAMFLSMVYSPTFIVLAALCHSFESVASQAAPKPAVPSLVPAAPVLSNLKLQAPAHARSAPAPSAPAAAGIVRTPGGSALRRRLRSS